MSHLIWRICCEDWSCNFGSSVALHVNTAGTRLHRKQRPWRIRTKQHMRATAMQTIHTKCSCVARANMNPNNTGFRFQTFRRALKKTVVDKQLETSFVMCFAKASFCAKCRAHTVYDTVGRRCPRSAAPRSAALHCAALRCPTLGCAPLRHAPLRHAPLRCASLHSAALCCAARRPAPLRHALLRSAAPPL